MKDKKLEAKPIFIVGLPIASALETAPSIGQYLKDAMPDYHTIAVVQTRSDDITFQAFFPQDFDIVGFEAFKEQVLYFIKP